MGWEIRSGSVSRAARITQGKCSSRRPRRIFATQRDVGRRKRDIRTIVLKVRLDNPKGAYVPGMTAEVLFRRTTEGVAARRTRKQRGSHEPGS